MRVNVTRRVLIYLLFAGTVTLSGCLSDESVDGVSPLPPSGNGTPTISGNPPGAVTIGDAYSFTPTASDPEGDALTFGVQNIPLWAAFDTATGELSGSPTLGDIGPYNGIAISVSDGPNSASLAAFSITVTQVATGSVSLSWLPPTQNEDGTPLTDLAGFRIYYGTAPGTYTNSTELNNPGLSSWVVENLIPGTYYFVTTAFNQQNFESAFSNEAVKIAN